VKNAQAKIDALLEALVDQLQDEIAASASPTVEHFDRLKTLITLSNLNNARQAKVGKLAGPESQSKAPDLSDADLVEALKSARPKDLFPRRGPPNGKRESVSTPAPVFCAVHPEEECAQDPDGRPPVCPRCLADSEPVMLSLKDLRE
jgi:hypothetical protein